MRRAADWPHSSVRAHLRSEDDGLVTTGPILDRVARFADLLETDADDPASMALRRSELIGRPLGSEAFIHDAEARLGRTLAPGKRGPKRHPTLGLLPPARFVPLAEETGLITGIGAWVINEACRQAEAWRKQGMPPVRMSVNVSARQFRERGLTGVVAAALSDSGLDPRQLELELTESMIMQDVDQALGTMEELEELGVQLSIDDFGTGYSSLAALKTFPVGRLKIDMSFIKGLPDDEDDRTVAAAVISLGQKLKLKVIAEGVETAEQVDFLRRNCCDEMQGYHLSKPIPPDELAAFLRRWVEGGGAAAA